MPFVCPMRGLVGSTLVLPLILGRAVTEGLPVFSGSWTLVLLRKEKRLLGFSFLDGLGE